MSGKELKRQRIVEQSNFIAYEPEIVSGPMGSLLEIQECEELIVGRWEPYISIKKTIKPPTY
jgi:hypothetical protein